MNGTPDATPLDLDALVMTSGRNTDVSRGFVSILEAAALWGGEEPSFEPRCVSPVLTTFVGMWNEGLNGPVKARRQELKGFIPRLARSARAEVEEVRIWMIGDWLVRDCAAAALDATEHPDLREAGRRLRGLHALDSNQAAIAAVPVVREAKELIAAHHDECRPDANLREGVSWKPAVGRVGALAAWNAVVDPDVCSHNDAARAWRPEVLEGLARDARSIVEQGIGLVAAPAARLAWTDRSTTPPFVPRGSSIPGPSWMNRVADKRRRYGQHTYHAGIVALAPLIDAQITSALHLLDRLLELTERQSRDV